MKSARLELPEYTKSEIYKRMSRSCSPARCMGTAFTVLMTRKNGHRFNPNKLCLLTLMPVSWWAIFSGTMRISRISTS